jgi:hypothetical protein
MRITSATGQCRSLSYVPGRLCLNHSRHESLKQRSLPFAERKSHARPNVRSVESYSLLVVGDGEAIGALAVDAERLVLQHARQLDVSMWAISMIFFVPVPLNSACTMAPGLGAVSSIR